MFRTLNVAVLLAGSQAEQLDVSKDGESMAQFVLSAAALTKGLQLTLISSNLFADSQQLKNKKEMINDRLVTITGDNSFSKVIGDLNKMEDDYKTQDDSKLKTQDQPRVVFTNSAVKKIHSDIQKLKKQNDLLRNPVYQELVKDSPFKIAQNRILVTGADRYDVGTIAHLCVKEFHESSGFAGWGNALKEVQKFNPTTLLKSKPKFHKDASSIYRFNAADALYGSNLTLTDRIMYTVRYHSAKDTRVIILLENIHLYLQQDSANALSFTDRGFLNFLNAHPYVTIIATTYKENAVDDEVMQQFVQRKYEAPEIASLKAVIKHAFKNSVSRLNHEEKGKIVKKYTAFPDKPEKFGNNYAAAIVLNSLADKVTHSKDVQQIVDRVVMAKQDKFMEYLLKPVPDTKDTTGKTPLEKSTSSAFNFLNPVTSLTKFGTKEVANIPVNYQVKPADFEEVLESWQNRQQQGKSAQKSNQSNRAVSDLSTGDRSAESSDSGSRRERLVRQGSMQRSSLSASSRSSRNSKRISM